LVNGFQIIITVMRTLLCFFITIAALSSCAQTKPVAARAYGYLLVTHMGTIAVDESGRPTSNGVDSTYKIYVEVPANVKAKVEEAVVHNYSYPVQATMEAKDSVQVGVSKWNDKPLFIKPSKGNKIVILQLSGSRHLSNSGLIKPIKISGTLNNKNFSAVVDNIIELKQIQGQ
jgi:hypothetical protein